MKNDERPQGRRTLLRGGFALVGLAVTAACTSANGPGGPAKPSPAGGAAGAPAKRPMKPSAYRLEPMTGYGPQRAAPARPPVRKEPILQMSGGTRSMVLTFDDGPDPNYTPQVLDILRSHHVKAMFFVCGEMAKDNPDLLRRMIDEGHTVGNHTWSHPELPRMTRRKIRDEIESTVDAVDKAVGETPRWFRAPYGAWNRDVFELGSEYGMEPLAWTVDTLDWSEPGTSSIVRRVIEGAAPGVVVLSHDAGGNRSQTVAALRRYLPELLSSGYELGVPTRASV